MSQPASRPEYTLPPLFNTMNVFVLMAVPPGVVTLIKPEPALVGTTAVICASESTLNMAPRPLKVTADAPVRFVPAMTTSVLAEPLVGEKEKMVGGGLVWPSTLFRNTEAMAGGRAVKNVYPVSTSIWLAEVTYAGQELVAEYRLGTFRA